MRQLHHGDQNWKYLKIGKPIKEKGNDTRFQDDQEVNGKTFNRKEWFELMFWNNIFEGTQKLSAGICKVGFWLRLNGAAITWQTED